VDSAGKHFLAGAGRAVDQHGDVGGGDALGQREQRQALGIGGDRLMGATQKRGGKAGTDGGVFAGIGKAGGVAVAERDRLAAFVAQDQRAGSGRRHFAFGDEKEIIRGRTAFLARADAKPCARSDDTSAYFCRSTAADGTMDRIGKPPEHHPFGARMVNGA
jgi:hypothetical protein